MSLLPKPIWEPFDLFAIKECKEWREIEIKVFDLGVFPQMSIAHFSGFFAKYLQHIQMSNILVCFQEDFCSHKDGVDILFSISLDIVCKKKHKIIIGGKKKADWKGTSGPKKQCDSEFYGFSFCLTYPRLGAREVCKNAQTKKNAPIKACSL